MQLHCDCLCEGLIFIILSNVTFIRTTVSLRVKMFGMVVFRTVINIFYLELNTVEQLFMISKYLKSV